MRDRWLTLLLAGAALAAFCALFLPKPAPAPALQGLPLSTDGRPEGYLALWRWLGEEHIPRVSLRLPYDSLPRLLPRPRGNVLLVTLPQRLMTHAAELNALRDWIARGNTLLIVAALDDSPSWASETADPLMMRRLRRLTGLRFTAAARRAAAHPAPSASPEIRPRGPFPLLAGVRHIATSVPLARSWTAKAVNGSWPLALAARSDDGDPVLWLQPRGAGQIVLLAVASPFSNAGLLGADNARLLGNLIAWSRGGGGAVVFDDAHQGLTAFYDAQAFFADPRLHATLLWILLLWLAFVIGSQPLRLRHRAWQPLDETAYVEAAARYLAAVVRPAAAAQRLIEEFLDGLRARMRFEAPAAPGEGAVWQWLQAQTAVSAAERRELQACYARACAGERVDLSRLQNLLAQLRRNLS